MKEHAGSFTSRGDPNYLNQNPSKRLHACAPACRSVGLHALLPIGIKLVLSMCS